MVQTFPRSTPPIAVESTKTDKPSSVKINSYSKMKDNDDNDDDLCICGRTLIVGDGTVLSPGFVTLSPKTGLIKAVSDGSPSDQSNFSDKFLGRNISPIDSKGNGFCYSRKRIV